MKKYLFLPGGLMLVGAVMWAAVTLHWDRTALILGGGGVLALAAAVAANWQNVRDWFRDPRGIFVLNSLFTTILLVAILGLVNAIAGLHAVQFDLTAAGRNTLTAETRAGLERLDRDVLLKQFGRARDALVDQLLSAFSGASPRVRTVFADLDRSPQEARTYGVLRDGTVVVTAGEKWRKVETPTEAAIYQAIAQVTQASEPVVCFSAGAGEHGLDDQGASGYSSLGTALAAAGYRTERVSSQQSSIPQTCQALVVAGPAAGLSPSALNALDAYLHGGGGVALLVDPPVDAVLRHWLGERAVQVGQGVIIETNPAARQVGAGPESALAITYFNHQITHGFGIATIYERAVPLTVPAGTATSLVSPIAGTGDTAFERVDLMAQGTEFREGRDRRGPFLLGVAVRVPKGLADDPKVREGRMVVFGDSDFLSNAHVAKQGNRDLALRTVAWLVGEEEARIVSLADRQNRRTAMTERTRIVMYAVNLGLLPLLPLIAGLVQFFRAKAGDTL